MLLFDLVWGLIGGAGLSGWVFVLIVGFVLV